MSNSVRPHRWQPTRLPRPWDSSGKNTGVRCISFSSAWKWKVKVKSLSRVWLFATPWTAAYQAPPSLGFSRQEYWSGGPLPSLLIYARYPVTKHHTLGDVKRRNSLSYCSGGWNSKNECQQGCSFWGLWGSVCSGGLLAISGVPWLLQSITLISIFM